MPTRDEIAALMLEGIRPENVDIVQQPPQAEFPQPQMGSLASQLPQDPFERAALRTQRTNYPRAEGRGVSGVQTAAEFLAPETPFDYAMTLATGPAGKLMSAPVKIGTMALGGILTPSEAEGGVISKAGKKLKQIIGIDTPAPYPQFAEEYPKSGPPVEKPREKPSKTGETTYLAKELTPEAQEFEKVRNKIIKQMDETGFQPYFDPAKRTYVDPTKYPAANVNTVTDVRPTRAASVDEYHKLIDTPETKNLLNYAYDKGLELGNAHDWYAVGQLEKAYIKEYGAKEGRRQFLESFAAPMAATTSGNNPAANYALAHYFEFLKGRGMQIPESHQFPVTVGGRFAGNNAADYIALQERGGYAGLGADQPKMHNFTRNFIGDLMRATMDEQMATGMLQPQGATTKQINNARKTAFGMLEQPVHEAAAARGVNPANFQDVAWAGFKGESEGPFIDVINRAIERTHRLTGMARDEIVRRGIIRKEIPVYGMTGTLGGLAAQDVYNSR